MPLLKCPGATRSVVPDTLADIWSMPAMSMCRDGHEAKYAETGGWCETCSVRKTTRTAPASMDVAAVDVLVGLRAELAVLLELFPLAMLADSEARWELGSSSAANGTGVTSQCARKCSPSTELYGLHTLPCCSETLSINAICKSTGGRNYKFEVLCECKSEHREHADERVVRVVDAVRSSVSGVREDYG